jgi:DnaA family protein
LSTQITLPIDGSYCPTLENFIVGENAELLAALQAPYSGFRGIWISGVPSSGRSHMLRAYCEHAVRQGRSACYIECAEVGTQGLPLWWAEQQQRALNAGQGPHPLVLVDDVAVLQNHSFGEEGLMAIYQHLHSVGGEMLVSHTTSALGLEFSLPDLNSRMRGLEHFALLPLNDQGKAQVLSERASAKGYELTEAVLDYWLRRGPRDLATLVSDLQRLDQATLVQQRLLTVPLLKQVLGY